MDQQPLLSVVLPVYNEAANIERALRAIDRHAPADHEVLVVYDRDDDDTLPVARALAPELPRVRLVRNAHGRGVLAAMRTGIEASTGRSVLITMADGSDDVADLPAMLEHANRGAAIVAASRYVKGGAQHGGPWLKRTLSRAAGLSLHLIGGLSIHDPTSNYKLYAGDFVRSVTIESRAGFELALELVVKAHRAGLKLAEVPTTWRDRTAGESHFDLRRWLPHYLHWYVRGLAGRFGRH